MNVLKLVPNLELAQQAEQVGLNEFILRPLTRSDIADVISLEPQIFPRGWSRALVESEFENPCSVRLGIFLGLELAGYSFSRIVEDEFNLLNIGVKLPHRGIGLGQVLLQAVLKEAQNRGSTVIFLEVRESNKLAQKIYQKAGFRITGKRPSYYSDNSETALIMELPFL